MARAAGWTTCSSKGCALAQIRMRLSQYFRNRQRSQGRHRFLDQLLQWETAAFSLGWQDARRSLCYAKRAAGTGARPRARSGPGADPTGGMINMIHLSKAAKLSRSWGPALASDPKTTHAGKDR